MREMKNSGVEWIGEIPADWNITTYRRIFNRRKEYDDKDKQVLSLTIQGVKEKNDSYGKMAEDFTGHQIVKRGDLVFTPRDFDATPILSGIAPCDGCISNLYFVLYPHNIDSVYSPFYNYFMWGVKWGGDIWKKLSYGMRFSYNFQQFGALPTVLPSLDEQHRIADFLDEKCAKIDAVIEKQKQVIEKLKEYKLSVITEAVTKGLDPTVPMKDSGVEWIGEIPKGWKVTKLSRVCKTSSGSTPARNKDNEYFLDDAKIRWVRTLDLNDGLVYDSSEKISNVALLNSSCSIMPKDTVCVAMYGGSGTIGKCGILQKECATNQAICSIVCDNKIINPYYMFYQMISSRKYWMKFAVGTRKDPNISQEIVANAIVVAPSLNIQSEIIGYLNNKCSVIDSAIVKKQSIVEKLTEYKKSLIYEVVTGKKEV